MYLGHPPIQIDFQERVTPLPAPGNASSGPLQTPIFSSEKQGFSSEKQGRVPHPPLKMVFRPHLQTLCAVVHHIRHLGFGKGPTYWDGEQL